MLFPHDGRSSQPDARLGGQLTAASIIPREILLLIFNNAVSPPWILKRLAEAQAPQILDTNQAIKRAIVSVCKLWHAVGSELLYNHVQISSIGQLATLMETLDSNNALCALVKSVQLSCYVTGNCRTLFEYETARLLELCPRLSAFSWVPPFLDPTRPVSLPALSSKITQLEFSAVVPARQLFLSILPSTDTLQSLALCLQAIDELQAPSDYDVNRELLFPTLRELRIHLIDDLQLAEFVSRSPWRWRTPCLEKLWMSSVNSPGTNFGPWTTAQIRNLLDAHGKTVNFLSLGGCQGTLAWSREVIEAPLLQQRCPKLEHLVLPLPPKDVGKLVQLCHEKIAYLDVYHHQTLAPHRRVRRTRAFLAESGIEKLPAIRIYRGLDAAFAFFHELPIRCLPRDQLPPGAHEVKFGAAVHFTGQHDLPEVDPQNSVVALCYGDEPAEGHSVRDPSWLVELNDTLPLASLYTSLSIDHVLDPVGSTDIEEDYFRRVRCREWDDSESCESASEEGGAAYLEDEFYAAGGNDESEAERDGDPDADLGRAEAARMFRSRLAKKKAGAYFGSFLIEDSSEEEDGEEGEEGQEDRDEDQAVAAGEMC
ncbi:hypothetical protein MKEN_00719700 [Mycena kentingensis (nom. inval.)]|nr:hypothetical protein MKEN_00719700 [Mycena kentingensis (nom. inval.)]